MTRQRKSILTIAGLAALSLACPGTPSAMGQGPSPGYLFVGDNTDNSIKVFDTNGNFKSSYSFEGVTPYGMAYNTATSSLYVASIGTGAIYDYHFNSAAGTLSPAATPIFVGPQGNGHGLIYPNEIAFDPNGNLYVSSFDAAKTGQIFEFSSSGAFIRSFAGLTAGPNPGSILNGPTGIAFDGNGNLFVNNSTTGAVIEFTSADLATSAPLGKVLIPAFSSGLGAPAGLAVSPDNSMLIDTTFFNTGNQPTGITKYNLNNLSAPPDTYGNTNLFGPVEPVFGGGNLYLSSARGNAIDKVTEDAAGNVTVTNIIATWASTHPNQNFLYMAYAPGFGIGHGAVPEPSSLALLGLGGLAFLGVRRQRARRSASA